MFRKVMFWIGLIMVPVCCFYATALQVLPLIIAVVLMGLHVYGKKDLRLWIIIVGVIMLMINLSIFSLVDVTFWGLMILAFARK